MSGDGGWAFRLFGTVAALAATVAVIVLVVLMCVLAFSEVRL